MVRHTKDRAEQTREAIIDAGIQTFFRNGVARASLEDVAKAAGVTRGAVYWHFGGKHELFAAVEDRLRGPQLANLEALLALGPAKDPLQELQQVIENILMGLASDPMTRMLWVVVLMRIDCAAEDAPALKRQAEHQQRFQAGLQRFFREIVPSPGAGSLWSADTASAAVMALVQGTILRSLRFPDDCPIEQAGLPVIRNFLLVLRSDWIRQK